MTWPDVGVLEHRGSARAASYLQSESADSSRDQSSARSGGGEAVVSGAGNYGDDDIHISAVDKEAAGSD